MVENIMLVCSNLEIKLECLLSLTTTKYRLFIRIDIKLFTFDIAQHEISNIE